MIWFASFLTCIVLTVCAWVCIQLDWLNDSFLGVSAFLLAVALPITAIGTIWSVFG